MASLGLALVPPGLYNGVMAKRLVELEWEETSGVDAPANDVPGWAVLKAKTGTVHHGRVLAQIKVLVDDVLARQIIDEEEGAVAKKMTKADLEKAVLAAILESWPPFATEVAAIVKEHGRTDAAEEPLTNAFERFRKHVEIRMTKMQGTVETVRSALQAAISDKYPDPAGSDWCASAWIRDFDDNEVIYDYDGHLWVAPYMINDTGEATLGDPAAAQVTYTKK